MITKEKITIGIAMTSSIVVVAVLLWAMAHPIKLKDNYARTETFYVATPAGEAFEVVVTHECRGSLQKAAIHATYNQDVVLAYPNATKTLEALTKDFARIYNGDIKNQCEIEYLTFTKIIPEVTE
jgi:hypothetical protein